MRRADRGIMPVIRARPGHEASPSVRRLRGEAWRLADRGLAGCVHESNYHRHAQGEVDDDRYADLANAIWLLAYNTGFEFTVSPHQEAEPSRLNQAWVNYGDVSW
jgi:hypothetical protein